MSGVDPPPWFRAALQAPVETGVVVSHDADIAYRAWGPRNSPGVVLVHGGAAHSRWWDHVAPLLTDGRRVVALDLSGHGDSGRRSEYTLGVWAHEVMRVAGESGITGRPVVVGHSLGGFVALDAATEFGDDIDGTVIIDSPALTISGEGQEALARRAFGPLRTHLSRAAAVARFRPVPDQDTNLTYVMDHVAETSVVEHDGGWTWKFDPRVFQRPFLGPTTLTPLLTRVALLRAENGRLTQAMSAEIDELIGGGSLQVEIPAAGHHVMLDEPLSLVTALRAVLASWSQSRDLTVSHVDPHSLGSVMS